MKLLNAFSPGFKLNINITYQRPKKRLPKPPKINAFIPRILNQAKKESILT